MSAQHRGPSRRSSRNRDPGHRHRRGPALRISQFGHPDPAEVSQAQAGIRADPAAGPRNTGSAAVPRSTGSRDVRADSHFSSRRTRRCSCDMMLRSVYLPNVVEGAFKTVITHARPLTLRGLDPSDRRKKTAAATPSPKGRRATARNRPMTRVRASSGAPRLRHDCVRTRI
jgi:hypothetical protein